MTALLVFLAFSVGITGLTVLLHDLRELALTGYLALPTTAAAAASIGLAAALLTLA